jgi:hypothetical protein
MMTILVGPEQKPYTAHTDILTKHSGFMRALCAGRWAESQSREIDWSQWEEATVKRFLQWIYHGNYSTSELVMELGIQKTPTPSYHTDSCLQFSQLDARITSESESEAEENATHDDRGSPSAILIAHAKVYVLAQYTNTEALEYTALERLWNVFLTIKSLNTNSGVIEGIVSLVEYAYANTNALVNSEESLRSIISTFCAIRLLELQEQPEFHTLLHAGGDFVVELWEKVGRKAREDEQIGVKKFETLSAEKEQLRRELGNQTLEIKRLRRTCATLREQTQENEMLRVECDTLRERVLRVCRCRETDTHWDW